MRQYFGPQSASTLYVLTCVPIKSMCANGTSHNRYMNPMPNNPSVAMVAYSRASSNAGGPAALLPSSPVYTASPPEVELVEVLAAVVVAFTLFVTGSVAPHGWSC